MIEIGQRFNATETPQKRRNWSRKPKTKIWKAWKRQLVII